ANSTPLPRFLLRRSARRRPANTRRLTSESISSLRWNSSSKRSARAGGGREELLRMRSRMPIGAKTGSILGGGQRAEDVTDQRVGLHAFRFTLEAHEDAVAQRGASRRFHVLDRRGVAPLE